MGSTCGSTPKRTCASQAPPAARTPSTGLMSMFSITSANSLPSVPAVCSTTASTPAKGPSPNATTKTSANTMSGTVRPNSRTRMAAKRRTRDGDTLRLASTPPASPSAAPVTVPT